MDASMPVDSEIRRAARPVGATSSTDARWACAAAQTSLIVAVLPVPGPPVTIDSRCAKAFSTAVRCSGAGSSSAAPITGRFSVGSAASRSPDAAGELAPRAPRSRAGRRCRPRPRRGRAAARGGWVRSARPCGAAPRAAAGTSTRPARPRRARATARPPPGRASRARPPRPRRSVSAIAKPTPNTEVSSYGCSRTTRCALGPYCLSSRATSQASPCGASRRCSARVERSASHDRVASEAWRPLSPTALKAARGSRSTASSTPSP